MSAVRRVRNFLDSLGFFRAQWDSLPAGGFRVTPGNRAVVASESIAVPAPLVLDSLSGTGAAPRLYDAGDIGRRVSALGRRMAEKGYPYARIAVAIRGRELLAARPAGDSLTIIYQVYPDSRCLFGTPVLTGATATRQKVLLHDMAVGRGAPFDIRKVEETVEALKQRPYVVYAASGKPVIEPETMRGPGDSAASRDAEFVTVPIVVEDRAGLGVEGALGYNSREGTRNALQGDLTLSFLNVFHAGENASIQYAGDRTYQKFAMEAVKPWLLGRRLAASAAFGMETHESSYGFISGEAKLLSELQRRWQAGILLKGSETTLESPADSLGNSTPRTWHYYGADFLLSRQREQPAAGVFSSELSLATGGGVADRKRAYTRSHVDFTGGIHLPVSARMATRLRLVSKHLITSEDTLVAAELYRVGGYRSARGYMDYEFAFRTAAYGQLEWLYYFSPSGAAFIFLDGGFGFERSITRVHWGERTEFLGYGVGVRVPARLGTLTLVWARNKDDDKSLGRVHVAVSNNNAPE
jgi:outer membrane protein assembly factor BamA